MGVPISNYTVLKFLADGIEKQKINLRSFEMDLALDAMENYSTFAFIIHDPSVHKDFHDSFEKQFKSLHYSSGEHLVFFGLVDSPQKHCLVGKKPFYTDVRDMVELYEEQQKDSNDYSYSAFAIANSLGIKPEMLPAIVITHDTRLSSYRWYKTCPDKIETQMSRLTGISNEMHIFKNNEKIDLIEKQSILYHLLDEQELDLCSGMGTTKLNESMARALSDLMSFLIETEKDPDFIKENRKILQISNRQKMNSLQNAINSLEKLKFTLNEVDIDKVGNHATYPLIEELSINLAIKLVLLKKNKGKQNPESLPIHNDWLENHSLHLLQTGLDVAEFLQRENNTLDYSASAICLAKMFEQEINYSIVHWIRKHNSIELPRYFNLHQPGVNALVKPKFSSGNIGYPVDFNKRKNGSWQPPELGKTKTIVKFNITTDDWISIGINQSREFLIEWDEIIKVRNKAAHTEIVSLTDMNSLKNSLTNLAKNTVLEKLSDLKKGYKNTVAHY